VTVPRVGYRFVSPAKLSPPSSERPSIAVLPFVNLSNDPEQAFFADGLAEEIIVALGKLPGIVVIARNSSFRIGAATSTCERSAAISTSVTYCRVACGAADRVSV
jgi:TolB-like protein